MRYSSKCKKLSPKNPEKLKLFLEKMKSKKRKAELNGKSNVDSKTHGDQEIVILDENLSVNTLENDRKKDFSKNLGQMGTKSPPQKLPNPQINSPIVNGKPRKFSDIRSFLHNSDSLVGQSNFYKVEKPAVGTPVGQRRRRYCLQKKEADLAQISNNPINKYFPKKEDLVLCKYGKRKPNIDVIEVNKKQRVGNQSTD